MSSTADVVIIGGGVMGASTAYHLALRGCHRVALVERDVQFGTGASGQNAGGIRHQFSTAVNIELATRSIRMLERFPDELDQEIGLTFCGYLFLLDSPRDVEVFHANVSLQHAHGIDTQMLDPDDIARLAPGLRIDDLLAGTFYERDGLADPSGVVQGYVNGARRLGATLLCETQVTGIEVTSGRVRAVTTDTGTIQTDVVVIAAGPWSAQVGELAGIHLPVRPVRRQIAVVRPRAAIDRGFPFTIDFSKSLYFHREAGGILTGMSNPGEAPGFDTSIDAEWRSIHFAHAIDRLPSLADAEVVAEWAGLYEVTPDQQPILGRLPQAEGLIACTGFSGHGFMLGPIAGLLTAEEILDGRAHTVDVDSLRWERFDGHAGAPEYNVI